MEGFRTIQRFRVKKSLSFLLLTRLKYHIYFDIRSRCLDEFLVLYAKMNELATGYNINDYF